jgi:hypothetical protein
MPIDFGDAPVSPAPTEAQKTQIKTVLGAVSNTGNESIAGVKQFNNSIVASGGVAGLGLPVTSIDHSTTSTTQNTGTLLVDATTPFTLSIPASTNSGNILRIINIGTGNLTIQVDGVEELGGATSQIISQQNKGLSLEEDTGSWRIVQDSRFLAGTIEGEFQYWNNTLGKWQGTSDGFTYEDSSNSLLLGNGLLGFGGDQTGGSVIEQAANLTDGGIDGLFNIINSAGNKLIQFGGLQLNLMNGQNGGSADDYQLVFWDHRSDTVQRGDSVFRGHVTTAIRPSDGAAIFGQNTATSPNYADDAVWIKFTEDATSTASGALRVDGGVGIGKNLNVGGSVTVDKAVEVIDPTEGVIIRSPDNSRWRITVDNSGNLTTTAI